MIRKITFELLLEKRCSIFLEFHCKSSLSCLNFAGTTRFNAQPPSQRIGNSNSSVRVSATPPPVNKLLSSGGAAIGNNQRAPRIGPGGRRMVKSFSQDAASSMASAASIALNTLNPGN